MSQTTYIDGGRLFIRLGPQAPDSEDIYLTDANGAVTSYDGETAQLCLYDGRELSTDYTGTVTGDVLTLTVDEDIPAEPGIYVAELVVDNTVFDGWVEVLLPPTSRDRDVLTVQSVRRYLGRYARGADGAYLSEDDFEDWLIAEAFQIAVEEWNGIPGASEYTTVSFPYLARFRDGVAGFACQTVSSALQRERMPAQSGGVSLDDKQRADYYLKLAQELILRYRDWAAYEAERKMIKRGFGLA